MADNEDRVLVLGKKALVTTLVVIALNPIGIAVGYVVGKWLQAPKLSIQTIIVEPETEGVTLPKDLATIVQNLQTTPEATSQSWRFRGEDQEKLKRGILSATVAHSVTSDSERYKEILTSIKATLEDNIAATQKWTRGRELLVSPIYSGGPGGASSITSEAPQIIVNRDKNELLGIYRSELREVGLRLEDMQHLLDYLQAHPQSDKRTGEAVIRVGVLNSGDSEGVVYPRAVLHSVAGEIDLTAPTPSIQNVGVINYGGLASPGGTGGYVVVPPRSFREITLVMDRSSRGDAAENWKKLVQSGRGNDVTVELRTSGRSLSATGKLPL